MKTFEKIIWAIDPYEKDSNIRKHAQNFLRILAKKSGAEIYPIYVVSDGLLSLSLPKSILEKEFKPLSEKKINTYLRSTNIPNIKPAFIPVLAPASRSDSAAAVDQYAQKLNANAIYVSSHGRKGLSRAFLGSFAETLTLHAKIPVILSGPRNSTSIEFKNILYPTDLSEASKVTFEKVVQLAKNFKTKLTILFVISHEMDMLIQSQLAIWGGVWFPARIYDEATIKQRARLEEYKEYARQAGVKTTTIIDRDNAITPSILKIAKEKKIGLIAMASESSAFTATMLGSIGRKVSREAPCALWFFRAKK